MEKNFKKNKQWVVIIEESLTEDDNGNQHTAYVSCKPLSDGLPKSGSMGKNCYYIWDSIWDSYDEGMAHKNKLVEQLKPSQMFKASKKESDKKKEYRRLNNKLTPEEQAEYEEKQSAYLKEKYKKKDKEKFNRE